MRVLQLVSAPLASGGTVGVTGPERRAANLAGKLPALGVEPIIVYPCRGQLWKAFCATGAVVVDYEISGKFDLRAAVAIANLAREHQVDLLHSQGPGSLDALSCVASVLAGKPAVITRPVMIEDIVSYSKSRRFVYALIDRVITARLARKIIAVSHAGFDHLRKVSGVSRSKLTLIRNGTNLSQYRNRKHSTSSGDTGEEPVVIGMIGHLLNYKGWKDFLRVIQAVRGKGLNVRGLVVGEGSQRSELEALARDLGLETDVSFLGYRSDIPDILNAFDIFLFTSHREGLSMAVLEAMATGLPIVASDVGGIREQVEQDVNGYVFRVGAIEQMAEAISGLVESPPRRRAMGQASRTMAFDRFDEHRMLLEYVACYREALGQEPAA